MNISTLSQQLNISVKELRRRMAEAGFKISPRARKIDNVLAKQVLEKLKPSTASVREQESVSPRKVKLPSVIAVKDLAAALKLPVTTVIKTLVQNGVMASLNEQVDFDTAAVVASELGFEAEEETQSTSEVGTVAEIIAKESKENLVPRPPIVAVMGHVDHGKTKLLDAIRKSNVAETEAGAITQHIGAYQVEVPFGAGDSKTGSLSKTKTDTRKKGKLITFLDTPGHEAFAAMRARGANVTDIIVLVVAADDGVMPQTLEVINRAKITQTPVIVAINKIDKPEANPERVKKQLAEAGMLPEEWGGKTIFVPISAKQNIGIDKLLEMILLTAEVEDFRANPKGEVVGTVIESKLSKTRGSTATIIVQNGTLKVGDVVVVGGAYGKLRMMEDAHGRSVKSAGPSTPVRIFGLSTLPEVGDILRKKGSIQEAQAQAQAVLRSRQAKRLAFKSGIAADALTQQLRLIIKADVQGSLEAIQQELQKLENQDVEIKIISSGVGDINESDVFAAESSKAVLIGFNVKVLPQAAKLARQKKVNIDIYQVIYELTEDITQAVLKLVLPEVEEVLVGRAKVLAVFRTERDQMIIGGVVKKGKMIVDRKVKIFREEKLLGKGKIVELQQNKQPAREVGESSEFGMKISTSVKIQKGDILEIVEERMKEKKLKKLSS